jgi:branched-chain amino acid transport system permease protein
MDLHISAPLLFGQLLIGLINGSFYAMMSLGVAVIFGMLRIANFVHGAQYMLGAFGAWFLLSLPELFPGLGLPSIGYWWALLLVPLLVGLTGIVTERLLIRRVYRLHHAYGLLLTVGLALVLEGVFRIMFGSTGAAYPTPELLKGGIKFGVIYLPLYRLWVIAAAVVICFGTWLLIERTRIGAYLRAGTENAALAQAFGINVPAMLTLTYGFGVALAGLAGVLAVPVYQFNPQMGQNIIIVIFAIVVIGGMGSIIGAIVSGFMLGIVEGLTKVFYPEASSTIIFIVMALVLTTRPAGLFGRDEGGSHGSANFTGAATGGNDRPAMTHYLVSLGLLGLAAPFFIYPLFLMKLLCFALFAAAYNLLFGYLGLLAFGHAAFFGAAAYVTGHAAKVWGLTPELAILAGTVVAAALGAVVGALAIRRQGLYFAMITLALAQIVYFYAVQAPWTHGEDGIQAIPRGNLFGLFSLDNPWTLYLFVLAVFLVGFAILYRTVNSPFGEILKAIRENEQRVISLGYNTSRIKLIAFVISAAISGLAGGTKTLIFQLVTLSDVSWTTSGDVLLMLLIGGIGTVFGPIYGAIVLVAAQDYLASFGSWVLVIQGAIFVFCVLFLRGGIAGALTEVRRLLGGSRPGLRGGRAPTSASAAEGQEPDK